MQVVIAQNCCLCYGAKRALDETTALAKKNKNIVLFKELLHNKNVIKKVAKLGVVTKQNLFDLTAKNHVVIRAHGEPKSTFEFLQKNNIAHTDCTCPNVKAINFLVERKGQEGFKIIIIGKHGKGTKPMHPEVFATAGWCKTPPLFVEDDDDITNLDMGFEKYFLVVQTTFSTAKTTEYIEKIKQKMQVYGKLFDYKNTTCSAQRMINLSSATLARKVDCMVVVGGKNSSNTKELFNNVSSIVQSFFVEDAESLREVLNFILTNKPKIVGLTGGASTTMEEVQNIKQILLSYASNLA